MVDANTIKIGDTIKYNFFRQKFKTGKVIDIVRYKSSGGHTIFRIDTEDEIVYGDEVVEIVG